MAFGVLLFLVLGWRGRETLELARPDEFVYLALSESIEAGSYREIYLASAPLHVKYPPVYPGWLAMVRTVAGEHLDVIRGANLLLLAAFLLCLYGIVLRLAGIPVALAAILLTALNPTLLDTGGSLLSEALFLALVGGSLLCTVRAGPGDGRYPAGAILFAIAAALTRTVGVAVLLAVGLWLWQRRKPRELVAFSVAFLLAVGGWLLYTAVVPEVGLRESYRGDIATGLGTSEPGMAARLLLSIWRNSTRYLSDGLPWALSVPTVPGTRLDNIVWLALMVALLAAGLLLFWRKARAVFGYLAFSGIVLALWPWRVDRLLVPLLPFVIAGMLVGMQTLTARFRPFWRIPLSAALVGLLGLGAARGALARDATMSRCERDRPDPRPGCQARLAGIRTAASEYLRTNAPEGSIVLTLSPAEINYLSGHRTAPAHLVGGLRGVEAARQLRKLDISYVLVSEPRRYDQHELAPALLGSCRELRVETRFPNGGFLLFLGPPRTPAEDACGALNQLISAPAAMEH